MFFHINESGNTGNNLFDPNQLQLSYGVLSSTANVDVLGKPLHKKMLQELSVDSLHANILGVNKLPSISPLLFDLQKRMRFDFDYYFIHKPTYALTMFFDAVFDAGLNEAVKWGLYIGHLSGIRLFIAFQNCSMKTFLRNLGNYANTRKLKHRKRE